MSNRNVLLCNCCHSSPVARTEDVGWLSYGVPHGPWWSRWSSFWGGTQAAHVLVKSGASPYLRPPAATPNRRVYGCAFQIACPAPAALRHPFILLFGVGHRLPPFDAGCFDSRVRTATFRDARCCDASIAEHGPSRHHRSRSWCALALRHT